MASTDTQESGICAWMASVRASMSNDPCRQLFEDQVQTHAFIFLDDYLEHILAGPRQAPIIELVKTPGRKKNMPRRTRAAIAAAAKANNTTSLYCGNSAVDVPVNSFHRALLQAKEKSIQDTLGTPRSTAPSASNQSVEEFSGSQKSVQVTELLQITTSIERGSQAAAASLQQFSGNLSSEPSKLFAPPERDTELSVIAEGDESPERSHNANILHLPTVASKSEGLPDTVPQFFCEARDVTERNPLITPLDHLVDPPSDGRRPVLSCGDTLHSTPSDSREVLPSEAGTSNHTEPLPFHVTADSPRNRERNAFTAPLPVVPVSDSILIQNAISVPLNDSPRALAHKNGTAGFPMLPAPSPLRKSMRVPQEALPGSVLPIPAPAPGPLGKRTSWLMKAREAKAIEGMGPLAGTSAAATSTALTRVSTALKRKSGEMLGVPPPGSDWEKDQRKPKVAKSTEAGTPPLIFKEGEKTGQCSTSSVQGEPPAILSFVAAPMTVNHLGPYAVDVGEAITRPNLAEDGFIDLFKRTVEDLGARASRSAGKSLGGAAVAALAEARAAAEAKVAERNKLNSGSSDSEALRDDSLPNREPLRTHLDDQTVYANAPQTTRSERRLSLSDLAPGTMQPNDPELSVKTSQTADVITNGHDKSLSTTPPDSPPPKGNPSFVKPTGPVFNKPPPPPPVFMAPTSKPSIPSEHSKGLSPNFPSVQFMLPVSVPLAIPARLTSPSDALLPIVQEASQSSIQCPQPSIPNTVVDDRDGVPMWVRSMRNTPYDNDPEPCDVQCVAAVDDDDDSWPLEERLAAAEPGWRPFDFSNVDKEDTWSSLPTESQGPTRSLTMQKDGDVVALFNDIDVEVGANGAGAQREHEHEEIPDGDHSIAEVSELEEVAKAGVTSIRCVEPTARSTSQGSIVSTASSSQSQLGFFSQATKLVNNMLGGGKKTKPELKSLQLAAAAAKKQQEEADKKMQRLRDMEARRQVATAKRAEEERKNKEELERRKREREEHTDRRPLKLPVSTKKSEDEASKKRRLAPETEKKSESKKPLLKDKKDLAPPTKSVVTPATKVAAQKGAKAAAALSSSTAYNATQNASSVKPVIPEAKPFKVVASSLKGKVKAKPQEDMDDKLPSTVIQSQMAARAKAQMQAAKLPTPEVPSESIELPEINSEYSDSDDEDRVRTFDPPDWAQSPELRQALQMQSTVNPDDIFGAIRPLRMEEMFRARQSRFRARTSSANWSGSDRLTVEEIREYERRMGFRQTHAS